MAFAFLGRKKRAGRPAFEEAFGRDDDTLSPEETQSLDSDAWLVAFDGSTNRNTMRIAHATACGVFDSYRQPPAAKSASTSRTSIAAHRQSRLAARSSWSSLNDMTRNLTLKDDVSTSPSTSTTSSSSRQPRFSTIPEREQDGQDFDDEMETKIFERQVQDLSASSLHHSENLIPPVLTASCEALTDDKVDPETVQVVSAGRHDGDGREESTLGLSPNRLSFYSYADVVNSSEKSEQLSPDRMIITTLGDAIRQSVTLGDSDDADPQGSESENEHGEQRL